MKIAISDVTIGKRFRKDMGDLDQLSADIDDQGLIVPIGVTPDYELVYGERRLRACKKLGWAKIEAYVIKSATDDLTIRKMEEAENNLHKPMTPVEKVALRESIVKAEMKSTKSRNGAQVGDIPDLPNKQQRANEIAQRAGFRSDDEYRATKKVVESKDKVLIDLVNQGSDPAADRSRGLSPREAVAVLDAPQSVRSAVHKAAEDKESSIREELRIAREKARKKEQAVSDMTQRIWRAMAPINWIVDEHGVEEGEMKGAFYKWGTVPPQTLKANKAGMPGLLAAVQEVRKAYQQFEKELKEVIDHA